MPVSGWVATNKGVYLSDLHKRYTKITYAPGSWYPIVAAGAPHRSSRPYETDAAAASCTPPLPSFPPPSPSPRRSDGRLLPLPLLMGPKPPPSSSAARRRAFGSSSAWEEEEGTGHHWTTGRRASRVTQVTRSCVLGGKVVEWVVVGRLLGGTGQTSIAFRGDDWLALVRLHRARPIFKKNTRPYLPAPVRQRQVHLRHLVRVREAHGGGDGGDHLRAYVVLFILVWACVRRWGCQNGVVGWNATTRTFTTASNNTMTNARTGASGPPRSRANA